ncbi:endonuclease domain-containing protein [Actinacidiphila glaucinigra]|uniref:endonuclease domain-containing protein n=1 Tax=Actinacidiphila glaucinigra TaxID=235986 RepID=UPI003715BB09
MRTKRCEECGTPFVPSAQASRYCGEGCRVQVQAMQLTGSMYSLTLEQVRAVRAVPACMICQSSDSGFESGIFAVDHCHETGVVRGALCQACNFMLGNARDDIGVLLAAVKYLVKDHSNEPWNQGKSRAEQSVERRESRLANRLEQVEAELRVAEGRVKELEAVIAEVDEDAAFAARRRVRDAGAVDRFVAEVISLVSPSDPPVAAKDLRDAWRQWSGNAPCPVQSLREALEKLGAVQRRNASGNYWHGVELRPIPSSGQ